MKIAGFAAAGVILFFAAIFYIANDGIEGEHPTVPQRGWSVVTDASNITDQATVQIATRSDDTVSCRSGLSQSHPTLVLQCRENVTRVLLSAECQMTSGYGGYGDVTYRVDDRPAVTRVFTASTDSGALGLWDFRRAKPFIDDLSGGEALLVRFTPFGESPKEITFDIGGVDEAIKPLREACGW